MYAYNIMYCVELNLHDNLSKHFVVDFLEIYESRRVHCSASNLTTVF